MRYLVVGSGAVGGYLGGRLALAGQPVAFVARPAQADSLRQTGLTLIEGDRSHRLPTVAADLDLAAACLQFAPQAILLGVKAYALDAVLEPLRGLPKPCPPVVCFLNGLGNEERLSEALGAGQVIAATLTTAVQVTEPGAIHVERVRGVGLHAGHPLASQLLAEFEQAELRPQGFPNAASMKWSKVLTNLVSNATSAIVGWTPAQVYAHPGLFRLEVEALRETRRVMERKAIPVVDLPGVQTRWFARVVGWPPRLSRRLLSRIVASGRGDKLPSFVADLARRRSEVEWLNGAVARQAETLGLAAPANRLLCDVLLALVAGSEDPLDYRHRPERLLQRAAAAGVPGCAGYNPVR